MKNVCLFVVKPQQNPKEVQEFYELREGESNEIRMMFRANPKPQEGRWSINTNTVELGAESLDQKYKSSFTDDGVRIKPCNLRIMKLMFHLQQCKEIK